MNFPIEISANPVDYTKLVNRETLQMRKGDEYVELHGLWKEAVEAYSNQDRKNFGIKRGQFLCAILCSIHNFKGDPGRLSEWGLQIFKMDEFLKAFPPKNTMAVSKNEATANLGENT